MLKVNSYIFMLLQLKHNKNESNVNEIVYYIVTLFALECLQAHSHTGTLNFKSYNFSSLENNDFYICKDAIFQMCFIQFCINSNLAGLSPCSFYIRNKPVYSVLQHLQSCKLVYSSHWITMITHRTYGSSNSNRYVKFQMFMTARAFWRVSFFCCFFLFYYTLANGFKRK